MFLNSEQEVIANKEKFKAHMDYIEQQADKEQVNWKEEKVELTAKVITYASALKKRNVQMKKLIKELERKSEQLKQSQKPYRAMKEVAKRLTGLRDEKDKKIRELSASNNQLSTELNEASVALDDVKQEVDKVQEELDEVQEELEEVKEE